MKRTFGVLIATFTLISFTYSQSFFFADQDLEFETNVNASEILVSLSTGEEDNNTYFFERSEDGVQYHRISTINPNKQDKSEYEYIDNQPFVGKSYYRLIQSTNEDNGEIIDIREVHFTTMNNKPLEVKSETTDNNIMQLTLNSGAEQNEKLDLEIYNHKGELIINKIINGGISIVQLENTLKSGIYSVIVVAGDYEKSTQLLIY